MQRKLFALCRWGSGILFCLAFAAPAWMVWSVSWLARRSVQLYVENKGLIDQMQWVRVILSRDIVPLLFVVAAFCCLLDKPKPARLVWRLYLLISIALALMFGAALLPYDAGGNSHLGFHALLGGYTFPYVQRGRLNGLQLVLLLGPSLALVYWLCCHKSASIRRQKFSWLSLLCAGAFIVAFALPAWKHWNWVRQFGEVFEQAQLRQVWLAAQYGAPILFALLILWLLWRKIPADSMALWLYFTLAGAFLLFSAASWLPFQREGVQQWVSFRDTILICGNWGLGGYVAILAFGPVSCGIARWLEQRRKGNQTDFSVDEPIDKQVN